MTNAEGQRILDIALERAMQDAIDIPCPRLRYVNPSGWAGKILGNTLTAKLMRDMEEDEDSSHESH